MLCFAIRSQYSSSSLISPPRSASTVLNSSKNEHSPSRSRRVRSLWMSWQSFFRLLFSMRSMSRTRTSSGRAASARSRRCERAPRCVTWRRRFCSDKGPSMKPGTGGRTLEGKLALTPNHPQFRASPSSISSSDALSSETWTARRLRFADGWVEVGMRCASHSLGPRRMNETHFVTKSSTLIPTEPASFVCTARRADRSPTWTRRRESRVASDVCLTFTKSLFARMMVSCKPSDSAVKYSLRQSAEPWMIDAMRKSKGHTDLLPLVLGPGNHAVQVCAHP